MPTASEIASAQYERDLDLMAVLLRLESDAHLATLYQRQAIRERYGDRPAPRRRVMRLRMEGTR